MIYFHHHTNGNSNGSYGTPRPSTSTGENSNASSSFEHHDTFAGLDASSDQPQELNGEVYRTFPNRQGYDPNFLGASIPLPTLDDSIKNEAAPLLNDPSKIELKYTHFSVVQDKDRRQPLLTAVNLDGTQTKDLARKGTWSLDARIDRQYQLGNEAYANNDIDKGHQVRRRDPQWGPEADKAGGDTFVYTNVGLQHADLNQRTWLDLEDHVLHNAVNHNQKVTVFTGPVLRSDDPKFDNAGAIKNPTQMPLEFWKMEVWNEPGKGIEGEAFVESQKSYWDKPKTKEPYDHLNEGQLQACRVPIAQLEQMTHIHFGAIKDASDAEMTNAK